MQLTFWGAAETVTGSRHLVEVNGKKILLDAGLFQGRRAEADQRNREPGFDVRAVDAVILSHAHIDHAGWLPFLYKKGFRGRVYATPATRALCGIMLMDSAYIQEKDLFFVNKLRRRRNLPSVEPLYEVEDAEGILGRFVTVPYDEPFEPYPGVRVLFRDAGHILGSASVHLTLTENGRTVRLGFTGDVGGPGRPLLATAAPLPPCDVLLTESTYGGHVHTSADSTRDFLASVIQEAARDHAKVLIPAFAVGRTQELIYALDSLWNEGKLPSIPVFIDSPLAISATSIYSSFPENYGPALKAYMRRDPEPFQFPALQYVRDVERSKEINTMKGAAVVISASGMCEAGRILHHLRNHIGNPKTRILMVGYCAEHTLGKRLIDKQPYVRIFGEEHKRLAQVHVMNSLSAHADEPGLLAFLSQTEGIRAARTYLVHGAPERQKAFKEALETNGWARVSIPHHGETIPL